MDTTVRHTDTTRRHTDTGEPHDTRTPPYDTRTPLDDMNTEEPFDTRKPLNDTRIQENRLTHVYNTVHNKRNKTTLYNRGAPKNYDTDTIVRQTPL